MLFLLPRHLARLRGLLADFLSRRRGAFRRRHESPPLAFFTLSLVSCQPFQLMSKTMPSGSLNLRSKPSSSGSPRSKKNLPPAFSICFCCAGRSSHWKPKWWMPVQPLRHAGADLALVLQQRQVDLAVAHVDGSRRSCPRASRCASYRTPSRRSRRWRRCPSRKARCGGCGRPWDVSFVARRCRQSASFAAHIP